MGILELILTAAPNIIKTIQEAHAAANPGAPPLTSEQIHEGLTQTFADSQARGDFLRVVLQAEIDAE